MSWLAGLILRSLGAGRAAVALPAWAGCVCCWPLRLAGDVRDVFDMPVDIVEEIK
jgi:hypothetical protein